MTTTSNTEIQQLKEFIKDNLNQLDRKIDDKFERLNEKIGSLTDKVDDLTNKVSTIDNRLVAVETKVDSVEKRFTTVESKLPDISEKFGELKNWRQIAFIIIAAVVGWLALEWGFARNGKM